MFEFNKLCYNLAGSDILRHDYRTSSYNHIISISIHIIWDIIIEQLWWYIVLNASTCAIGGSLRVKGRASSSVRKAGWCGWKPSSSSNFSIRACRAYSPIEIRQTAPCRAIRGDSISFNSTLPPSYRSRVAGNTIAYYSAMNVCEAEGNPPD